MTHGFHTYRVFVSGPGDLERDRDVCRNAISETNSEEAMPHKVLLVTIGLLHDDQIVGYRSAVAENIRLSSYFIQVFEDDWGPKNLFRKMFLLAIDCRDDASQPMRDVVVCLKAAPRETDPEVLSFRKELEESPGVRVHHYSDLTALQSHLRDVCSGWVQSILVQLETAAVTGDNS